MKTNLFTHPHLGKHAGVRKAVGERIWNPMLRSLGSRARAGEGRAVGDRNVVDRVLHHLRDRTAERTLSGKGQLARPYRERNRPMSMDDFLSDSYGNAAAGASVMDGALRHPATWAAGGTAGTAGGYGLSRLFGGSDKQASADEGATPPWRHGLLGGVLGGFTGGMTPYFYGDAEHSSAVNILDKAQERAKKHPRSLLARLRTPVPDAGGFSFRVGRDMNPAALERERIYQEKVKAADKLDAIRKHRLADYEVKLVNRIQNKNPLFRLGNTPFMSRVLRAPVGLGAAGAVTGAAGGYGLSRLFGGGGDKQASAEGRATSPWVASLLNMAFPVAGPGIYHGAKNEGFLPGVSGGVLTAGGGLAGSIAASMPFRGKPVASNAPIELVSDLNNVQQPRIPRTVYKPRHPRLALASMAAGLFGGGMAGSHAAQRISDW